GKSSLINMLTGMGKLAKISGKPGKTRLINHFLINDSWFMADLPGYGYAKVSKKERYKWNNLITNYILERKNLTCLFVLIDARLEPQKKDVEFMEWLGVNKVPFMIVFTKVDKLSSSQFSKNLRNYEKKMMEAWEELPGIFVTSSVTGLGKEEILKFIEDTNELAK
ncbi:MAG: ribosome biogenesis GTP-binding protein YihA/YsxC, partial [Bacteroidetes bacterium]|nr:ribosome biogenesis GTP-binding protein YihA/YsxC [Bacteroidota bacterium]